MAWVAPAFGEVPAAEKESSAEAPERPAEMPLSPIPEPPRLDYPPPRPEALEAIARLLSDLTGPADKARQAASEQLAEAHADWVGPISKRIDALADRGGREELARLFKRAASQKTNETSKADWVHGLLLEAEPTDQVWKSSIQLAALLRMLGAIGTTESVRELIRAYARFGEFVRIPVQHELDNLGDRSLAGLFEATRHPAEVVARWAKRQLDLRGKFLAQDAVRTTDPAALADILVAIGRVKDPEAARLLISFASSDRAQIRLAARQGLALQGEVAAWQLKDAYLDATGRRAKREWTWKRTARELFTELDRLRLAQAYTVFQEAKKAGERGDWKALREGYDRVLTDNPLFEEQVAMAEGYLRYAEQALDSEPDQARIALRRVERLGSAELRARAESLRHTLEAEALQKDGFYDRGLVDLAVALDAKNSRAAQLEQPGLARGGLSPWARYGLAGAVLALTAWGVTATFGGALRRRKTTSSST